MRRWVAGASGVVAVATAVAAWLWLPDCAPEVVMRWSPWLEPAARAAVRDADLAIEFPQHPAARGDVGLLRLERLTRHRSAAVRSLAVDAVAAHGATAARPVLARLAVVADPTVAAPALRILAIVDRDAARRLALDAVGAADAAVRVSATSVLGASVALDLRRRLDGDAADVDDARVAAERAAVIARLDDADGDVRLAALDALGRWRDRESLALLEARMDAGPPRERASAMVDAGEGHGAAAVPALAARLAGAVEPHDRRWAAIALGRTRCDEAVAVLTAAIADDRDAEVRASAIEAIGVCGRAGLPPLLRLLLDPATRDAAAAALARAREPAAIEPLLTVAERAVDPDLRRAALAAVVDLPLDEAQLARVDALGVRYGLPTPGARR